VVAPNAAAVTASIGVVVTGAGVATTAQLSDWTERVSSLWVAGADFELSQCLAGRHFSRPNSIAPCWHPTQPHAYPFLTLSVSAME
jgi:hypothetical protein